MEGGAVLQTPLVFETRLRQSTRRHQRERTVLSVVLTCAGNQDPCRTIGSKGSSTDRKRNKNWVRTHMMSQTTASRWLLLAATLALLQHLQQLRFSTNENCDAKCNICLVVGAFPENDTKETRTRSRRQKSRKHTRRNPL